MSCLINIDNQNYTFAEVLDMHLNNAFDDTIIASAEGTPLIEGVPLRHQLQASQLLSKYVSLYLEDASLEADEEGKLIIEKKDVIKLMDDSREFLIEQMQEALDKLATREQTGPVLKAQVNIQQMIANVHKLEAMALRLLASKKLISLGTNSIEEFLEFVDENDFRNFDEDFSFERDPKDSLSIRVKLMLSNVVNPEKKNFLGLAIPMDIDEVYGELQALFSGMYPDRHDFMNKMREYAEAKPWLKEVIHRLETFEKEGNLHLVEEFVTATSSHPVKMVFINYKRDFETGTYTAHIVESNRSTRMNLIRDHWMADQELGSKIYTVDPETNEAYVNKNSLDRLREIIKLGSTNPTEELAMEFLNILGFTISDDTLKFMQMNNTRIGRGLYTFKDLFSNKYVFPKIIELLSKYSENNVSFNEQNMFMSGGDNSKNVNMILRAILEIESKYSPLVHPRSFRTAGGKTITSQNYTRAAQRKLSDLLSNRDGLREEMKKLPFNANILLNMMDNSLLSKEFEIVFPDAGTFRKIREGSSSEKELVDMTAEEHLQVMMDLFFNNGVKPIKTEDGKLYRPSYFMFLTMSDKKNKYVFKSPIEMEGVGNFTVGGEDAQLNDIAIKRIVDNLVIPEARRILKEQGIENRDIKGYNEGRFLFYFFPELNDIPQLFENGQLVNLIEGEPSFNQAAYNLIMDTVRDRMNAPNGEFVKFMEYAQTMKIDNLYLTQVLSPNMIGGKNAQHEAKADFFVNSMVMMARMMQLFTGDPAMAHKKTVDQSWGNYTKRLSKDNTSGITLEDAERNTFNLLSIKDAEVASNYLKELGHKEYESMNSTDAQAFISLKEYAYIKRKRGEITFDEYNKALEVQEKGGKLPEELMNKLINPMKPVYVGDQIKDGIERKVYVKCSVFPLIPELTAGTHMDEVRKLMNENDIDIAAFGSAIKLGDTTTPVSLFDADRNFVMPENIQEGMITELPRNGFKIQQEIPVKKANEVNRGTQFTKLLFNSLRNIETDVIDLKALEERHDRLYVELYKAKANKLFKEIFTYDAELKQFRPNFKKFNDILKQELVERNYDQDTMQYFKMELEEIGKPNYEFPFWAIPITQKLQPVINSIIDSRIRKTKFPGKSYVLASSTGFKTTVQTLEEYQESGGEIIFTKDYQFGKDLAPQRFDGKKVHPAEVIVPWNLQDEKGNVLDIKKFMTEDGYLDTSKIDPKLLEINGFRIPTQDLNSMSYVKIVGFLPKTVKNMIIAPAEYVTQMGSDFDVDKLYTYMKYYETTSDGNIRVITPDDKHISVEKRIINEIIDIQTQILSAPVQEIQDRIKKPLDYGLFDNGLHNRIAEKTESTRARLYTSPLFQVQGYAKAAIAKQAVGSYSLSSTFNSMIQSSSINFDVPFLEAMEIEEGNPFANISLYRNGAMSNHHLNYEKTIGGKRTKADVISAVQSAAVDNENQQILEKVNINKDTLRIVTAMAQLGFDEEQILLFLNQTPFILLPNTINDKMSLAEINEAINKIAEDKGVSKEEVSSTVQSFMTANNATLEKYLGQPTLPAEFQLALYIRASAYSTLGQKLTQYQQLLNIDSSGVKKNFYETWVYEMKFRELFERRDPIIEFIADEYETPVKGSTKIGEKYYVPKNLAGALYFYQLKPMVETIYSDERYSLLGTPTFQLIIDDLARNLALNHKRQLYLSDYIKLAPYARDIQSSFVKFLLSNSPLFPEGMSKAKGDIKELFETVVKLKETSLGKNNALFKALRVVTRNGENMLYFDASYKLDEAEEEIRNAIRDMWERDRKIVNPTTEFEIPSTKKFILDLVKYNFLTDPLQGATNFVRFIPPYILKEIGIHTHLKGYDLYDAEKTIGWSADPQVLSIFTKQFIQNNPDTFTEVADELTEGNTHVKVGNRKISAADPIIVRVGDSLYQANGEIFVKIPRLNNLYNSKNPNIQTDKLPFHYYGDVKIGKVESTKEVGDAHEKLMREAIEDSNVEQLLTNIEENSESDLFGQLAKRYRDSGLTKDMVTMFSKNVPVGRTIYTPKFNAIALNPEVWKRASTHVKEKYVLHEVTHGLTKKAIRMYQENPDALTKKQKDAIKRLELYRDLVRKKLSPAELRIFEAKHKAYTAGEKVSFTGKEREIIYGSKNLEEFVAAVMTSYSMQKFLDYNVLGRGKERKTFLQQFTDLVAEILKAFGIDLKNGSLARAAYEDVMILIDDNIAGDILIAEEKHAPFELTEDNPLLNDC